MAKLHRKRNAVEEEEQQWVKTGTASKEEHDRDGDRQGALGQARLAVDAGAGGGRTSGTTMSATSTKASW